MNNIIYSKTPTTFEEQIKILRSRNLIINDENSAIDILSRVNYYRLSAYMLTFKSEDMFFNDTTIENIYNTYCFDKKFRNLLVGVLESIEIEFRTHIAYHIAHKYGALGHLDYNNFIKAHFHEKYVSTIESEIDRNREDLFVIHHKTKYNGQVPVWVVMEITTFGTLSMFFNNLKIEDKKAIGLMCGDIHYSLLTSWLKSLSHIRNVCAHYNRVYNKRFNIKPVIPKKYEEYQIDNERIFAFILVIKHSIQNKNEWDSFLINLKALIDQYEIINLSLIGFPINWYEILVNNTVHK
ncbi:Abi family protein [Clostridium sp. CS001]|uniref:Abi family protein n=1 Tax=Clostridium sp. CS001 TaxID=2880648 RepID=UPI001CF5DC0C|nr:Abi family protein [Clostridium sp. CS001]MCB2289446.1 Abi family protein [Clostridium sp. CS001]